jgi:hypothetical protein
MTEQKKVSTAKRFSGWVPDLPDHRDKMYGALREAPAKLPSAVDLRPTCSPVKDRVILAVVRAMPLLVHWNFWK